MSKVKKIAIALFITLSLVIVVAPTVSAWGSWSRITNNINNVHLAGEFRWRTVNVSGSSNPALAIWGRESQSRGLNSANSSPTRPAESRSFTANANGTSWGAWRAAGVTSPSGPVMNTNTGNSQGGQLR